MYNDAALRKVDEDVATVLQSAMASSKAGAGVIYGIASGKKERFDLIIDVEDNATADYYGFTDVIYTGTSESFLFGTKKLDVQAATAGLSLRIVLNVGHAKTSGQRMSTLVHEIGVHGTVLYGGIGVLSRNWTSYSDEKTMKGALVTQLECGIYSADVHHAEFGKGAAFDYTEFKDGVLALLDEWGGAPVWKLANLVGSNKWAALKQEFIEATTRGEDLHAKVYWHPVVQYQEFLKSVKNITATAEEFNARAKSGSQGGGLLALVKSLFG